MILYSVSNMYSDSYERTVVIDQFISAIWTERFIEAGEVTIVLPAVHEHLKLLAPGNLLGCSGSREIMLLETRSIEGGLVTAKGKTIETYFNERYLPEKRVLGLPTLVGKGGDILKGVVNYMQDWPAVAQSNFGSTLQFYLQSEKIYNLAVASPDLDETGPIWTETIPSGPVYDTLLVLAKKYRIGQSVVWTKLEEGHRLVYTTRQGKDLTQGDNLVRFSSDLDNLGNPKQLLSVTGSKNIASVNPPEWLFHLEENYGFMDFPWNMLTWNYSDANDPGVFGQRYIEVDCTDLTKDKLKGDATTEKLVDLFSIMKARLRKVLDEHKRTKIVDGEIIPGTQYEYKEDYNLGDIVQVQGDFGEPIDGVVMEYIRSQDETGERQYPTVSTAPENVIGTTIPDVPDGSPAPDAGEPPGP